MEEPKAYCFAITVVGALKELKPMGDEITAFLQQVEHALMTTWPDFLPGNPAVSIQVVEVRDDWIRAHNVKKDTSE